MGSNEAMVEYWNGAAGAKWVEAQARYDAMLDPVSAPTLEVLDPAPGERILDVGCGAGSFTLQVARRLDGEGLVTGCDISRQLLDLAAARADAEGLTPVVELVEADAQTRSFEAEELHAVTSRFGVMFFADPTAAFSNLAHSTEHHGRLAMTIWQPRATNEWAELPMSIAGRFVPEPSDPPDAPGPWALGDADRTRSILTDAGWRDVELTPSVGSLLLGGPATLEESVAFAVEQGMVSRLVGESEPSVVARVRDALTDELAARHDGTGLRLDYAVWIITAIR